MKGLSPIFTFLNGIVFVFSFILGDPDILVYSSLVICVFMLLDKLGKGIVLRETIALFNSFIYLFMPLMGYLFFTKANTKAFSFIRFMPVPKETYFTLALPAVTGFIFLLCWPLSQRNADEGEGLLVKLERVRVVLDGRNKTGMWMMGLGLLASLVSDLFPVSLQYILQLFFLTTFVGLLYVFFSGNTPFNNVLMAVFVILLLLNSLRTGMFTIIVYMGMTVFSLLFLNRRVAMWRKLLIFFLGVFTIIIIQSVKPEYRKQDTSRLYDNEFGKFTYIIGKRLGDPDKILTTEFMWPIYYRANQGFYVALVQNYIPKVKPHDNGQKLALVFASAFIPRLLWPDKPMAGGYENMRFYTGFTLRGYTMNVGPLGEAYGSFGRTGAIIFMLFMGFLIRLAYRQVFVISNRIPLLVLWLPVLFFEVTYAGENDTLQIVNSLVKAAVFIFLLYRIYPQVFLFPGKLK